MTRLERLGARQSAQLSAGVDQAREVDGDSRLVRAAITQAQDGDMEALHFLYVRYSADVFRHVKGLVKNHHEAEDISQNVFMKLVSVIDKYEPREVPFAAWILRVARNAALDQMRERRVVPRREVHASEDDHRQISHERRNDLRSALKQLTEEQRSVLVLRHIQGLTPLEIADLLGKSEGAVHGL